MLVKSQLRTRLPEARSKGQLRDGFRFAWAHRDIRGVLAMVLSISAFSWNHLIILPVFATITFGGGAGLYGLLQSLVSVGSLVGAIAIIHFGKPPVPMIRLGTIAMFVSLVAVAAAPSLWMAVVGLMVFGAGGAAFNILSQTRIQLDARMRGARELRRSSPGAHSSISKNVSAVT